VISLSGNQTVSASDDVKLECQAVTDPDEMSSLKVTWLRDGHRIDYDSMKRITFNSTDKSLFIAAAEVADTSAYSCHGNNSLDGAESDSVHLIVQGNLTHLKSDNSLNLLLHFVFYFQSCSSFYI